MNSPLQNNIDNKEKDALKHKYDDYPQRILELINKVRQDPNAYADIIEDSIKNIYENNNEADDKKAKIVYKNRVKVALSRGTPAFKEAANELRTLKPMGSLELKKEICVPLPENEIQLNDSNFLREQVKVVRKKEKINVFFKDTVKIPDVSFLLMIVDDNKNAGKKRKAVLNPEFKYIGVNSKFIGKNFVAYFSFSK